MTANHDSPHDPDVREQLESSLAFLERARRFWFVPLLALVVGALAFGVFSYLRTPKYRSETVILYVERGGPDTAASSAAERSVTARLKELLFSRPKLEGVISRFQLYPEIRSEYGMVDAVEELKKHIEFRAPGGDTFSIAFEGTSAVQAQGVTKELARLVIDGDSELRLRQARGARDFLASEKQSGETHLRDTEQKLASFMALHPRFALDATPLANGVAVRATMPPALPGQAPARAPWAPPAAQGPSGSTPRGAQPGMAGATALPVPVASDAEESRARAALAAAREHLAEQLARYTPAHPDVRAAETAVERATQRLAAVSGAAPRAPAPMAVAPASSTPSAAGAATAAATAPRSAPPAIRRSVAAGSPSPAEKAPDLVDLETQWLQLTRAVTEARQRQDQIELQLFKADMQAGSEAVGHGVQVNVIDPAFLPERPQPPGRTTIALIFAAVALTLGLLAAVVCAALDERLFGARDVAGITEVLVEIPRAAPRKVSSRPLNPRRAHVARG